jgi:hypothetical protein
VQEVLEWFVGLFSSTAKFETWWFVLLVSLLSGLLALWLKDARDWLRRPKLSLSFSQYDLGLVVDTPAARPQPSETQGQQRALRLIIRNTGKTTAHGVIVSMIEFCYFPPAGDPQYLFDEVLDLARALTGRASFDLGPKSHRWIDLAYSDDFGPPAEPLRFGFEAAEPARLRWMGFGRPGHYHAAVLATAENAEATSLKRLDWLWNGTPQEGLSAIWATDRVLNPFS